MGEVAVLLLMDICDWRLGDLCLRALCTRVAGHQNLLDARLLFPP